MVDVCDVEHPASVADVASPVSAKPPPPALEEPPPEEVDVHADEDVAPAADVVPAGHAEHAVAEPPAEYVFAAHVKQAPLKRYWPAEHDETPAVHGVLV